MDSLGRAYLQKGDLDTATRFVRQALDMNLIRDDQWDIAYGLISLAEISCAGKNHRRAALLLAAANATYDDLTARLDQYDLAGYTECAQSGRQALGSELFDEIWSRGLKLTPDQAIADGTAQGPSTPMPGPPAPGPTPKADPGLSEREIEVLALLAQGHSNAELAERLFLSLYTINAHLRTIYRKLNVSSRAAATRYALEHGLA
jgi:DNA-binding NarL/FixJ family response regulator